MKGSLIYFGDPMCSWCYGYAPQISKIKEDYGDSLNFQLVMGGLRPGGTETVGQIGSFLKHHWEEVNQRSGQPFNYEVLKDHEFVYDTEPPCRAVVTMRSIDPSIEFDFYKAVQEAFYTRGVNTNNPEEYISLVKDFGISEDEYRKAFASTEMIEKTREDFLYSQQLGVRGFPTTVLQFNEQLHLLANGYSEVDYVKSNIEKIMNSEQLT